MSLSMCSKVILHIHSKNMIPMSITECTYSVSWEGRTTCSAHTQHHWKSHHMQLSPSTFPQHTWNLSQKTYFCDAGLWINGAWGHKFHGCFGSSAERWWWPDRYSALQSATIFKGSLFAKHRDGVSLCPDANPDMWILKPAQPNLLAFRDAEHLTPEKTSTFTKTSNASQAQEATLESYGL